jgi:rhodanese-related sulfurtransferase
MNVRSRVIRLLPIALLALACAADTKGLPTLSVPELANLLARDPTVEVCDANTDDVRNRYGVLPGARLLSSYRDYDPARELPADKSRPLVFYCHSERCGAAVTAARRAVVAGHTNVSVLPPGIRGWDAAGKPVERPSPS